MSGFKTWLIFSWNMFLNQVFNVTQLFVLICGNQANRLAGRAGSTCATNPMDVIFRYVWQIKINDKG